MKKNKIFNIYTILHLVFIAGIAGISAYNSYCDFYKLKKNDTVKHVVSSVMGFKPLQWYGRITGCDAGYGFFAPNVRSSGRVSMENGNSRYVPHFRSREASLRFSTFESIISERLIRDKDTSITKEIDSLTNRYFDLLYKNIAAKIYNQQHLRYPKVVVSYHLFEPPTLAAYRKGKKGLEEIQLYRLELLLNR